MPYRKPLSIPIDWIIRFHRAKLNKAYLRAKPCVWKMCFLKRVILMEIKLIVTCKCLAGGLVLKQRHKVGKSLIFSDNYRITGMQVALSSPNLTLCQEGLRSQICHSSVVLNFVGFLVVCFPGCLVFWFLIIFFWNLPLDRFFRLLQDTTERLEEVRHHIC